MVSPYPSAEAPDNPPTASADVDPLHASPPAWSTHSNLLAVAAPPTPPGSTASIHLTHFAGQGAASPRVALSLPVPVPVPVSGPRAPDAVATTADARVSHLSFSPDSCHLVAVVSTPLASDLVTLYEQRGACVDEWDCTAQEDCARFTPEGPTAEKHVVSLRWVGESRRVRWPPPTASWIPGLAVSPC